MQTLYYNEVKVFFLKIFLIRYPPHVQLSGLISRACGIWIDGKVSLKVLTLLHVQDWIRTQNLVKLQEIVILSKRVITTFLVEGLS